ncbi:hypothetical protein B0H10DRAFT_1971892 [Mycena sp. CBHHK59/15]|nr:hypothetical protein B0H10DRAFT_1971892 [Mycena sp. CBHHK59/15]
MRSKNGMGFREVRNGSINGSELQIPAKSRGTTSNGIYPIRASKPCPHESLECGTERKPDSSGTTEGKVWYRSWSYGALVRQIRKWENPEVVDRGMMEEYGMTSHGWRIQQCVAKDGGEAGNGGTVEDPALP